MTNVFNRFAQFVLGLTILLAISGGFYYRGDKVSFEISQLDPFAFLLLLIFSILILRKADPELHPFLNSLRKLVCKLQDLAVRPKILIWTTVVFFGLLFLGHWLRHLTFETHLYDMNYQHQPLFFPLPSNGGNWFHCDACRMGTLWGEHIAGTFALLAFLVGWIKSDVVLFATQSALVATAFWYFITRGPIKEYRSLWLLFFLLFALSSPFRNSQIWDFREDNVGFACLMVGLALLWNRRVIAAIVAVLLAMWSKENFPLVTFLLGAVVWISKDSPISQSQRRLFGTVVCLLSLVSFFIIHKVIIPNVMKEAEAQNNILRLFPGVATTMSGLIKFVFTHPIEFLSRFLPSVATEKALRYLLMTLAPLLVFGRASFLWALPGLAMTFLYLLTGGSNQLSGSYHYELVVLPFVMMAVAVGIHKDSKRNHWVRWSFALLIVATFAGRMPVFDITDRLYYLGSRIPASFMISQWTIPNESIAASVRIIPHFNHVRNTQLLFPPGGTPTNDRAENVQKFLTNNPRLELGAQNRSIETSKVFALRSDNSWEVWLKDEVMSLGGRLLYEAKDLHGEVFVSLVELPKPLVSLWCEQNQFCAEK